MLYLLLADWTVLKLPNASEVREEGLYLVCCEPNGREIARYDRPRVIAYGTSRSLREYFEKQEEAAKGRDSSSAQLRPEKAPDGL
jgi:hypothetical protein